MIKKMDKQNEPNLNTLTKMDSILNSTRKTLENNSLLLMKYQKDISSAVFSWKTISNTNQNILKLSDKLYDYDLSLSSFLLCKVNIPEIKFSTLSNYIKKTDFYEFKSKINRKCKQGANIRPLSEMLDFQLLQ